MKKIILSIALAVSAICTGYGVKAQVIRTVAGNDTLGYTGDGGPAVRAQIGKSWSVVQDTAGNMYIADDETNYIRKVSRDGIISTIAGVGYPGYTGDGGSAVRARLNYPSGLALDAAGNLYFADNGNFCIRKISTSGIITTVVGDGSGVRGNAGDGGPATSARLAGCIYLAFDKAGNMYICDGNARIRKVNTSGTISTFAGSGALGYAGNGVAATTAALSGTSGIAIDTAGNVFFSDQTNHLIRKINTSGVITNFAGIPTAGGFTGDGGAATSAKLNGPGGLAVDTFGNVYVADQGNFRVRKISAAGIITTIAGNGGWAYSGDGGVPTAASLKIPTSVFIGNSNHNIFITDRRNFVVREIRNQRLVSITASAGTTICAGTLNIFTVPELPHDLGLIHKWTLNGTDLGIDSNSFASSTLHTGDVISYKLVDPIGHFTIDSANALTMTVNTALMPSVTLTKSTGDTVCSGTSVTFVTHPTNGGTSPAYNWMVNGINVASGPCYTYTPATSDVITASLTSSISCPTVNPVLSTGITMTATASLMPAVAIAGASAAVCPGTVVTYTAMGINTGTAPAYQWKKFGVNVGTGTTFTYAPANGDYITCELTSNATCAAVTTVNSSTTAVVNSAVSPLIDIVALPGTSISAPGQMVTFYSEVTYGGSAATYQWYLNGVAVPGATGTSFANSSYVNDKVKCVVNSNAPCADTTVKTSNTIEITGDGQLAVGNVSIANMALYPNPNNGRFMLNCDFPNATSDEVTFQVFDVTGKIVYTGNTTAQQQSIHEQVNLGNDIQPGQYILKVSFGNEYKLINFVVSK